MRSTENSKFPFCLGFQPSDATIHNLQVMQQSKGLTVSICWRVLKNMFLRTCEGRDARRDEKKLNGLVSEWRCIEKELKGERAE